MIKKLLVAVTGASCLPLSIRFLKALKECNIERHLALSNHVAYVEKYEHKENINWDDLCEHRYKSKDIGASVCSGSFPLDGMVVVPCSMNTLAHIANGIENSLITRAAGVNLKQERPVILVTRETPLSTIHIKNMLLAKQAGCSIVPPNLAFYFGPKSIENIVDHIAGKILELLHIDHSLYPKWKVPLDLEQKP